MKQIIYWKPFGGVDLTITLNYVNMSNRMLVGGRAKGGTMTQNTGMITILPIRCEPDGTTYRLLPFWEVATAVARSTPGQPTIREVVASLYPMDDE